MRRFALVLVSTFAAGFWACGGKVVFEVEGSDGQGGASASGGHGGAGQGGAPSSTGTSMTTTSTGASMTTTSTGASMTTTSTGASMTTTSSTASTSSGGPSVDQNCASFCDHLKSIACDSGVCVAQCVKQYTNAGGCADAYASWLSCTVSHLASLGCGTLPPECNDLFNAYTTCKSMP